MDESHYLDNDNLEKWDWWFVGRRKIISNVLTENYSDGKFNILEVGCGTGGNIALLENYGNVTAVESNIKALEFATKKTKVRIYQGSLPDNMPLNIGKFDLICLFDVLEHIDDDLKSVKYLFEQIVPGGRLIITVPAYQCLYGPHDISLHHKRRYSITRLINIMSMTGFKVQKISHFNSFLFPIIFFIRILERIGYRSNLSLIKKRELSNIWLNKFLLGILYFEAFLLKKIKFPYGLSIIGVFIKENEHI